MSAASPDGKASLRRQLRALRAGLGADTLERAAVAVAARVLSLPELQAARSVGMYMAVRREIPTTPLVHLLQSRGVTVAVPRVIAEREMELRLYQEPLVPDLLGIPTSDGPPVAHVDVLVCPGLAFDAHGARLGYGGGTFDLWLTAHSTTVAIGVCLDEAVVPTLPRETHDHPMALVVTPTRTLRPTALRVVAALWFRNGRVLVARRGIGRAHEGLWELPGGKVEPGEADVAALSRELREELGIAATVLPNPAIEALHPDPDLPVHLIAFEVLSDDPPVPSEHSEVRWVADKELDALEWAPADRPLLPALHDLLRRGA